MSLIPLLTSPAGLRRVLWADAISGSAIAALHLAAAEPMSGWLGLPAPVLSAAAVLVLPFVLLAGMLALQRRPARVALAALVLGNLAWVGVSAVLLLGGGLALTGWGQAYVLLQALAVLGMAELEWMGLRRLPVDPPATPA